jgi:predicted nuclease of predicted toxin-antitoxin system
VTDRPAFVVDEHVANAVVSELRRRGVEIARFHDFGRRSMADSSQLEWAAVQRRVIVTFDPDFVELGYLNNEHAGVVYCHSTKYSVGGLVLALFELWEGTTAAEMAGRVRYL